MKETVMSAESRALIRPSIFWGRSRLVPLWGSLRAWFARLIANIILGRVFDRAYLLMGGPVFFETVRTATRLDLFTLLARRPGLTAEEIARELKLEDSPAKILLMGCVALKLLRVSRGRYRCRITSRIAFNREGIRYQGPYLEFVHHIMYQSFYHYYESVTESRAAGLEVFAGNEDNLYARISHNPELEKIFHEGMQLRSERTNGDLLERVNFKNFKRVLDVGGGNGANLIAMARHYPHIVGTLLDYPTVADRAAARFRDEGLAGQLRAMGANVLEDEFPRGHDCILFCHFVAISTEEVNKALMRRAWDAVEPGGMVCIYNPFLNDDQSGPMYSAVLSPYQFGTINGKGRHYSWKEVSSWLEEAGFVNISKIRLTILDGAVFGFKPC